MILNFTEKYYSSCISVSGLASIRQCYYLGIKYLVIQFQLLVCALRTKLVQNTIPMLCKVHFDSDTSDTSCVKMYWDIVGSTIFYNFQCRNTFFLTNLREKLSFTWNL